MKTKLLLAGLLAGAMAFGTACKTGNTNTGTGTDTTTMGTDAGTGGAGLDHPDHNRQGVNPVPEEGTRELEPGVHEGTRDEPGTGGAGLEEPMDRTDTLGGETSEEPLNPGAPATGGNEGSMRNDEGTSKPRH